MSINVCNGLKSNMDRFIETLTLSALRQMKCLKSNMDRFIVCVTNPCNDEIS